MKVVICIYYLGGFIMLNVELKDVNFKNPYAAEFIKVVNNPDTYNSIYVNKVIKDYSEYESLSQSGYEDSEIRRHIARNEISSKICAKYNMYFIDRFGMNYKDRGKYNYYGEAYDEACEKAIKDIDYVITNDKSINSLSKNSFVVSCGLHIKPLRGLFSDSEIQDMVDAVNQ